MRGTHTHTLTRTNVKRKYQKEDRRCSGQEERGVIDKPQYYSSSSSRGSVSCDNGRKSVKMQTVIQRFVHRHYHSSIPTWRHTHPPLHFIVRMSKRIRDVVQTCLSGFSRTWGNLDVGPTAFAKSEMWKMKNLLFFFCQNEGRIFDMRRWIMKASKSLQSTTTFIPEKEFNQTTTGFSFLYFLLLLLHAPLDNRRAVSLRT